MNKVKVRKGYHPAFVTIGRAMHENADVRDTWRKYIANLFKNTLTNVRYRLPDMDELGDAAGETFVTEWINKVIK